MPLGPAIGVDHSVDCLHQVLALWQAQLLDKKVLFDGFQLGGIAACNGGGITVIDRRAAADGDFGQQIHIWRDITFCLQIISIFGDQFGTLAHYKILCSTRSRVNLPKI